MLRPVSQERKMSENGKRNPDVEDNVSKELAKEFKWVEFAQVAKQVRNANAAACRFNGTAPVVLSSSEELGSGEFDTTKPSIWVQSAV
jgi:hypothetical protein